MELQHHSPGREVRAGEFTGESFSGFQLHTISAFGSNNPRQAMTGGGERGDQSCPSGHPPHQLPRHTNPDWVASKNRLCVSEFWKLDTQTKVLANSIPGESSFLALDSLLFWLSVSFSFGCTACGQALSSPDPLNWEVRVTASGP